MKDRPSYHGLLVLDKPGGRTSRDVVNHVQRWFPRGTRLGHTGTLDPLATGVLVLCVGTATRLTEYVQDMDKTYRAGIQLGARSDTDDADGLVTPVAVDRPPDGLILEQCVREFVGDIEQVPPAYSAAKVTGQRAYDLARRGKEVALQPRGVRVYEIRVHDYAYPRLELEVRCGKGTYIRSLARDLGERLGCGGLVETLRRTRVGPFLADEALTLDTDPAVARARLLPLSAAVAGLPRVQLRPGEGLRLQQGRSIDFADLEGEESTAAAFDSTGALIAVVRVDREQRLLWPEKVLTQQGPQTPF